MTDISWFKIVEKMNHVSQTILESLEQKDKNRTDKMIIPIRCFSCGKPIGHLWESYKKDVEGGKEPKKALDRLKLERYCCRGVFLSHVDLLETISKFKRS